MKYITIHPPESLKNYVRTFWVLEGEASIREPYTHRVMADGSAELVFHYRGIFDELVSQNKTVKSHTSGLNAQSQRFKRFTINQNFGIFGAHLYPYAISHLFSIPATVLKDQMLDLKTLLGKDEDGLEEKIMTACDTPSKVKIMSQFLERRVLMTKSVPYGILETINYIMDSKGMVDVTGLAERNFLSLRQFERNFKRFSGFSPKLFSRITRFQNSLDEFGKTTKTLTEIAFDHGYADQSHFIREFKEFSGYTPREYFFKNGEGSEWRLF